MVRAEVNGVVGPVGDPHGGQPSGVVDNELDVVGVGSAAPVVDDHDRLAKLLDTHLQVPIGHRALPRPGHGDAYRLDDLGVALDGDQSRGVERRKRLGGNAVGGYAALAQSWIAAAHGLGVYARPLADRDRGATGGPRGAVVQATQPPQRGEPPDLVAAVRNLERVHVKGGEQLALVVCDPLDGCCQSRSRHPTAPSICSSISRLSSSAYSIGSSLAIGSTKPRTTIAIASSSVSPRLIR
ncbi:Uncharacterised protein [Mycobacterium tuberculosis]|nr:Uncharacterised protein [Mycobacterium tuberculosis]